ncbi:MAG: outer membrane beta-barrel protein [Nitrospiraceae bacterium]|jgi:opacity protein-like surface antigen|nr:outer membrane beta-barrel protein [Nitrospiraceae bacterium]
MLQENRKEGILRAFGIAVLTALLWVGFLSKESRAEWYVAGQIGPTFADRLSDIGGTGSLSSVPPRFQNFDLKNSLTYGAKLGYFPGHGWFGLELDAFNTTPHIKQLDGIPGVHLRVTTVALNFIVRYPGLSIQPYAGIGAGAAIAQLGESPGARIQGGTDVASAFNLIAGVRFFVTPYVALYSEYKYTSATLQFDNAFGFGAVGGFIGDYRAQHLVAGVSYHF